MNKNTFYKIRVVLVVIIAMMQSSSCSCSEQDVKDEKEAIIANSLVERSDVYTDDDFLIPENKDEMGLLDEMKIVMVEETEKNSEKKQHYKLLVDLNTQYIGSQNWEVHVIEEEEEYPAKFNINKGQIDCQETPSEESTISCIIKKDIDGQIYCIESRSEGAAGTIYVENTYSTIQNGKFVMVSCVIRYPQCMNYSELNRSRCRIECEKFDLDKIMRHIVTKLMVKKSE